MKKVSEPRCCPGCRKAVSPKDRYCRYCGAAVGKGAPPDRQSERIMQCIYGPAPIRRQHVCKKCGYAWSTMLMIDNEMHCPKCGESAPPNESRSRGFPISR